MEEEGSECDDPLMYEKTFYYATIGPAVLIAFMLSFNKKRRHLFLDVFEGRPGVLHPMDLTTKSKRIYYACAFGSTAYLMIYILMHDFSLIDKDSPFMTGLSKFTSSLIFSLVYLPVFTCLTVDNAIGYLFGSLYTWMLSAVGVIRLFNCPMEPLDRFLYFLLIGPYLICSFYLSFYNTFRFLQAVTGGDWLTKMSDRERVSLTVENIRDSSDGRHVRQLLTKPASIIRVKSTLREKIIKFIKEYTYTRDAGFTYSARLLATVVTGLVILYQLVFQVIGLGLSLITNSKILQSSDKLLFTSFIVASFIFSGFASLYNIIRHMKSYRRDMYRAYRGEFRKETIDISPANLLVGAITYSGYQISHIALSFTTNTVIGIFISCGAYVIVVSFDEIIEPILEFISPYLFWMLFNVLSQKLSARFVFLQNPTHSLAITNRRIFFLFAYLTFFFNVIQGFVMLLWRISLSFIFTLLLITRLEKSCLPETYTSWDKGYRSYLGFISLESSQNHPVMRVFINLLKSTMQEKRTREFSDIDDGFKSLSSSLKTSPRLEGKSTRRIVFRWQLLFTLINNPSIRLERRGTAHVIKEAARLGITFPKSDLLFDLNALNDIKDQLRSRSVPNQTDVSDMQSSVGDRDDPLSRLVSKIHTKIRDGRSKTSDPEGYGPTSSTAIN